MNNPDQTINKDLEEKAYVLLNRAEEQGNTMICNELKAIVYERIIESGDSLRTAVNIRKRLKFIFELLNEQL
jgi:hypothetical protein